MGATYQVQWTPIDEAVALQRLALWQTQTANGGKPVLPESELARVMVELGLTMERLLLIAQMRAAGVPNSVFRLPDADVVHGIGGNLVAAEKAGLGPHYKATQEAIRLLWRGNRRVSAPAKNADGSEQMGWVPFVLGLVGIAAAAVTTYFVSDRICQVYDGSAITAVILKAQLDELSLRIANGAPLPEPGKPADYNALVAKLAASDSASTAGFIFAGIFGLLVGGAAAYGATHPDKVRSMTVRALPASSSSGAADTVRSETNPKKGKKKRDKKGGKPKAKNPLGGGHSQETLTANVRTLIHDGKSSSQASAVALQLARASYRKTHPMGAYPHHLQTPAERAGHKPRKPKGKPKSKPKAKPKKKNPSKPKKKPNAKKGGKKRPKGERR